ADDIHIAAHHAIEPHAGLVADDHIADDARAGRDKHIAAQRRHHAFIGIDALHHGNNGACSRPRVSGKPNIRFMFCKAWPEEPFTRLSMVAMIMARPGRRSANTPIMQSLEPRTCLDAGMTPWGTTCTKGSSAYFSARAARKSSALRSEEHTSELQ